MIMNFVVCSVQIQIISFIHSFEIKVKSLCDYRWLCCNLIPFQEGVLKQLNFFV